jgi:hypothetical protein
MPDGVSMLERTDVSSSDLRRRDLRSGERPKEVSMADLGEGPMLMAKKFGGLVLVFLGLLGMAFGYEYGSGPLVAGGVIALLVGAGLLALKVIRRNPD